MSAPTYYTDYQSQHYTGNRSSFYQTKPYPNDKEYASFNHNGENIRMQDRYSYPQDNYVPHSDPPVADRQSLSRGLEKDAVPKRQRFAYFLIAMTVLQIGAMIWSFVLNLQLTGSVIQTEPFNFLIGPQAQTLIFMGARFVPCMRQNVTLGGQIIPSGQTPVQCPLIKNFVPPPGGCTLNDICGLGGFRDPAVPDQGVRFFLPVFLHGGLVHLLFNMMFQVKTGFDMEQQIGWWRIALIYFISGVAGFLFGASFAPAVSGVGASGALFGLIATLLLDLFYNWTAVHRPFLELIKMLFVILLTFFIGTLPGIDNFSHVGGFIAGMLASLVLLPPGNLRNYRWGKWIHIALQITAVPILIIVFWYFTTSFYSGKSDCSACQYVNCIPGLPWCEAKFQSLKG